jgi:hypothetical protein
LFGSEPIPQPYAESADALHATNASGELQVDHRRCVSALLEVDPIAENHGAVERETGFRAVPRDKLAYRVIVYQKRAVAA